MIDALAAIKRPTAYYEGKLGHWTRVLGNDLLLSEIGPLTFDRFIDERRRDGVTEHTISKELKCMITTLRYAARAGRYSGSLETLRPLGFSAGYVPRTRTLTVDELGRLLAELEPDAWAFVALCVALGIRRGEANRLRPEHVDQAAWVVHVPGTKTAGSRRDIPVLAPFRELVAEAAKGLPLGPWSRSWYYTRSLEVRCERAGIAKVTANDLRRTHATLLRSAGVGADVARALLGHTKGSQLLEQAYDKPKPHELAARAGDLSGLTAEVASLASSRKSPAKSGVSSEKTAETPRPWGPLNTAIGGSAPPIAGINEGSDRQEPVKAGEDSREPTDEETDLLAAIAEHRERSAAFEQATRPLSKCQGVEESESAAAGGGK
jgi:integrase